MHVILMIHNDRLIGFTLIGYSKHNCPLMIVYYQYDKKVAFEFLCIKNEQIRGKSIRIPNFIRTIWLIIFSQILKALENMLIFEKVNFICPLFPNFDPKRVC